jgi:hypothetical protein
MSDTRSPVVQADAAGPPATQAPPRGYKTVASAHGGYSLAVPAAWVVLDLSKGDLSGYASQLADAHSHLASYFSSNIWATDGGLPYTDFLAADPDVRTPTPLNVRGEHFAQPGNPVDHIAGFRETLQAEGLSAIDVRRTRVAGRDAVVASGVDVDVARSLRYVATNVFVECRPDVQCILVFYVPDTTRNAAVVAKMIRSLSFG